jgi:hypothetical protein
MGKVLTHALKPRMGKHKGEDLGGDWVHKAMGDSEEGLSRPELDIMRAEEAAVAAAAAPGPEPTRPADSVLRLGGGVRNVTMVVSKAIQVVDKEREGKRGENRVLVLFPVCRVCRALSLPPFPQPFGALPSSPFPHHTHNKQDRRAAGRSSSQGGGSRQLAAQATFAASPQQEVVPMSEVEGGAKEGDKVRVRHRAEEKEEEEREGEILLLSHHHSPTPHPCT